MIDRDTPSALQEPLLFQGELGTLTAALLDAHVARRYSADQLRIALT